MQKSLLASLLLIVGFSVTVNAGGTKNIATAVTAVVSIETIDPSPWYLGAGFVWAKLSEGECNSVPGCSYEDTTYGIMVRGGYDINQYFGIEARYIDTFLDEGPYGGTPLMHVGIFAKPQYPVSERINLYGLLGYGYTKNLGNGARLNYFDGGSGFSAGAGIEYDLSDREGDRIENGNYERTFDGYADQSKGWSLFLDYQRLLIESDIPDLDAVSFGVRYDF
jgi:OOP family OmpA-OmpF porin